MSEESFGQALRRHRRAAGLSQAQLAQELHPDQGNLSSTGCPPPSTSVHSRRHRWTGI